MGQEKGYPTSRTEVGYPYGIDYYNNVNYDGLLTP